MADDKTNFIGSPIATFIKKVKDQAIVGIEDWELKAPIDLELSTIVKGKIGGKVDIQVVNFGAKVEGQQIQKIRMSIGPKNESDEAKKKAEIAVSQAKEAQAKDIVRQLR